VGARLPLRLRLLRRAAVEAPVDAQHRGQHILGQVARHAGVFEPHQRQLERQVRQRQQRIDASAEIEHRA
jgi:hypothetical protein